MNGSPNVIIRKATHADLDAIVDIENESYGDIGEGATADPGMIRRRIDLLNEGDGPGWFWVADFEDRIVGLVTVFPTSMTPDDCGSWEECTDGGELVANFDPTGPNIYGVSWGYTHEVDEAVNEVATVGFQRRLFEAILAQSPDGIFMMCGRMPGFAEAHEATGVAAEDYWQMTEEDGLPTDPMLRLFQFVIGAKPERLLVDGFLPDTASGGHGVLCVARNAQEMLDNLPEL